MESIPFELSRLQAELVGENPRTILKAALGHCTSIALSFSGAEDVVLIDMACKINPEGVSVFTLDTGRLHPETYRFLESVRERYSIPLDIMSPQHEPLERLVAEKGLYSFYKDGHHECCGIRKVEPLKRKLSTLDAWITGQRKDQNLTRMNIAEVELDTGFSTPEHPLLKFNPLANWSASQVWDYIRAFEIPYNPLHGAGYVSIGCEPCTRPVLPHQHEREGRWWWETADKKECGLHSGNNT
ncbi:MAG: phosphoadenylyl-sulfate reductase [Methylococcaceae bacterium]